MSAKHAPFVLSGSTTRDHGILGPSLLLELSLLRPPALLLISPVPCSVPFADSASMSLITCFSSYLIPLQ
jgi:hypothetical protein